MSSIRDYLPKNLKPYTPEDLERARKIVAARTAVCDVDCPICGGLGWTRTPDPEGAAIPSGKLQLCPNVDPLRIFSGKHYGIEDDERDITWTHIIPGPEINEAAAAVRELLERGHGWLYLWGPPGVGKTLLLKIATMEALRAKKEGAYVRAAEIIDHLRAAFDQKNPNDDSQARLDFWANLPVLAIDEFDRVRLTEYANERRFLLMDRRYEQALRGKSLTIMTSNENPNGDNGLEGYLRDRVNDARFRVIQMKGNSYRQVAE